MRFLLLCLFLTGCGSTHLQANKNITPPPPGYKWYVRECGKCHAYYPANDYSGSQWHSILKRKKNKVSLTTKQFAELEQYLTITSTKLAP